MTRQFIISDECNKSFSFLDRVALGLEPNYSFVEKFGENSDIDTGSFPEDIWSAGGIYTFSTTADITKISSSHAGDTCDILIKGLDQNWNEVSQTVKLNGQSAVNLSTPLIRCSRAYNDSGTNLQGDVYISTTAAVIVAGVPTLVADTRAMIALGSCQTEMCIYTIPGNKQGYFVAGYISMSRLGTSREASCTWNVRNFGKTFRVQSRIDLMSNGNSSFQYKYPIMVGAIPPKSDIKITCESVSANNTGISGGFTILLEDI